MKWLIVVVFSGILPNGNVDTYIFTDPSFNTVEECIAAANDPNEIPKYVRRLFFEYGSRARNIQKIVCAQQDDIIEVIEKSRGEEI